MSPDRAPFSRERWLATEYMSRHPRDISGSRIRIKIRSLDKAAGDVIRIRDTGDGLWMRWFRRWILISLAALWLIFGVASVGASSPGQPDDPIPLLAYYYIWFDRGSWDRAKSDFPLLGRYSSDDEDVMRQHVAWAQQSGIDGFIVSWKSTDRLNGRLEQLIEIAEGADFKLAIIYQGLDFERDPLPVDRIADDLEYFINTYADQEVFDLFNRPLVIWSGTWEFSPEEISDVTNLHRDRLLILASERNVETYLELAGIVDGNAYYWSSVDPDRFPGYQEKLNQMGEAVHEYQGIWIAPAAPGFDARLIEGTRVIDRLNGETFIKELETAYGSAPDAIGIISWNEFSENTHIEPSERYGMGALEILAQLNKTLPPEIIEFESSEPAEIGLGPNIEGLVAFGLMGVLILLSLFVIIRRGMFNGDKS